VLVSITGATQIKAMERVMTSKSMDEVGVEMCQERMYFSIRITKRHHNEDQSLDILFDCFCTLISIL